MNKRRYVLKNRVRFFGFLFFIFLAIFIAVYSTNISGYAEPSYQIVAVQSGDTLWSIAEHYKDDVCDIREYIYRLEKINNMDSGFLIANTSILVPIKE